MYFDRVGEPEEVTCVDEELERGADWDEVDRRLGEAYVAGVVD